MGEKTWPVVLAALLSTLLLLWLVPEPSDEGSAAVPAEPAAQRFIAAYERSRTATFVVEQHFIRTLPDGRSIEGDTRIVQRPPDDRLVAGLGALSGRLGGRVLACATDDGAVGAPTRCTQGPPAPPYDEEVQAEVATLRTYVESRPPLYRVADGAESGCFVLTLALALPSPPYGDEATFCFDEATGAPTLIRIARPEATDETRAVEIRATITEADLRLPE